MGGAAVQHHGIVFDHTYIEILSKVVYLVLIKLKKLMFCCIYKSMSSCFSWVKVNLIA